MTLPSIQACFILCCLHMGTYRRPNGTQEHATLSDPRQHFRWEAIREDIVHRFTFGAQTTSSPDWHHPLEKLPTPSRSAQRLRICVIICLWACVNVQEISPRSHVYSAQRLDDRDLSAVLITLPGLPPLILQRPRAP